MNLFILRIFRNILRIKDQILSIKYFILRIKHFILRIFFLEYSFVSRFPARLRKYFRESLEDFSPVVNSLCFPTAENIMNSQLFSAFYQKYMIFQRFPIGFPKSFLKGKMIPLRHLSHFPAIWPG